MAVCPNCGGHNSERDDARGETVCTDCGAVLVAGAMVDELTFHSGGRMAGQFVDAATGNTRGFASMYGNRESRELALARGFDNLERVANKLGLDTRLVESAKLVYRLALGRGFTQGRPNGHVVSACLYAICRKQQSAQMLIDFSDALLAPVRPLAQVFMKLVRTLRLSIPTIDPSLFMERFAAEMELGEKSKLIAGTGVRLVQAMARDWIVTGRRPLGLCAAGLLIAARYHGIKLNSEEIDHIFRMSYSTIEKRVQEWSHTATAKLPVKDFESVDLLSLPAMEQPPCVMTAKRRKRRRLELTDGEPVSTGATKYRPPWAIEDDEEDSPLQVGAENVPLILTAEEAGMSLAGKLPLSAEIQKYCGPNRMPCGIVAVAKAITLAVGKAAAEMDLPPENSSLAVIPSTNGEQSLNQVIAAVGHQVPQLIEYIEKEFPPHLCSQSTVASESSLAPSASMAVAMSPEARMVQQSKLLEQAAAESPVKIIPPTASAEIAATTAASSVVPTGSEDTNASTGGNTEEFFLPGIPEETEGSEAAEMKSLNKISTSLVPMLEKEVPLDDIEDSVIEAFLLSPEEVVAKALMWDELTKDIMPMIEERRRIRRSRESRPKTSRKRRPPPQSGPDAVTAVKNVLLEGATFRSKLNESALEALLGT